MTPEILLRYLHFISILAVAGALVSEHLLLKSELTVKEIKRLARIDGVYGIAAILFVTAGLFLWFSYGKPAEFYSKNYLFHTKVGLAVILGLISLHPTIFFLKKRKAGEDKDLVSIPKSIYWAIRIELLILLIIPLLATMMAKGVGYFG